MIEMPKEVLKQFVNPYMNNQMFLHAKETYEYLNKITEENFISDHVCLASKTLERFYKGFLLEAMEYTSYVPPLDNHHNLPITETSHNLLKLRHEIQTNFPEVIPKAAFSEERNITNKLRKYTEAYKSASYDDFYEYSDLRKILSFMEEEVKYITEFLEKDNPFEDYQIGD